MVWKGIFSLGFPIIVAALQTTAGSSIPFEKSQYIIALALPSNTTHSWAKLFALSLSYDITHSWDKLFVKLKYEDAGWKPIWSDLECFIAMENRNRYRYGKQTISTFENVVQKPIRADVESWIAMDRYRNVVKHVEKERGTREIVKMQNAGWKFILANVKASWSVFTSDNESRYYGLNEKDYQMLILKILEISNLKNQPSGYHSEEIDIYNRDIQLNVFLAKEDYQILILKIFHKQQWNQILIELKVKCQPSCYNSEETVIYNHVIIFQERKLQKLLETLHGIESTALLATFILAAFAIRIVSEEEIMKDTLTHSPIVQITTKEVRQNLPRRAEEEASRQCGFCINHNQAIAYCKTCKLNICMPCKNTHKKVWTYINHTVCLFDEM